MHVIFVRTHTSYGTFIYIERNIMLQTFTLSSGLRVLVEELPHTHSISLGAFVGVGSGHEDRPICGISHFIEHMLFKGSQRRPNPRLIADAIEGVGGILDAYTSFESTVYYAKVADIHFDRALDVLADMLLAPCLDAKDIEKERRVIAEELRATEDAPSELIHLILDDAMWGDQNQVDQLRRRILSRAQLLGDHAALFLDILGIQAWCQQHIGQHI